MIDRLVIYLLLAGCLIFGAIVFVELEPAANDAALTELPQRPDAAAAAPRASNARLDELLAIALARPLFSSTRRPPQGAANDGASGSDLADTRLTGIVTEPGHHVAIFAVNGAKPLTLTEGEDVNGWRIENITPREVSLSGPGGTKTLEPKVDPNLVSQPGPTPAVNPAARLLAQPPPAAALLARPGVPPAIPGPLPPRPPRAGGQK
jgi:general secretion pathway protein N